jgi:beta-fructofuranosidase
VAYIKEDMGMSIFYKPDDGWAGDVIPFYWQGEYHLFYLKDLRVAADKVALGASWAHLGTRDFVHFTEYPLALPSGDCLAQDLIVATGSVIEAHSMFHIFYAGQNWLLPPRGRPREAIMHATSPDLIHWTKDAASPILFADASRFEVDDWRDPYVFWNDTVASYWMLLAARLRSGPSRRRGCIALVTSPDLAHWTIQDPFWAPHLYYTHECPDLFCIGDWWYLVYSTFSDRYVTHYRMSRRLGGPWTAPENDTFDGRAFYAAKTASDGTRRFSCGWVSTRERDADDGGWEWGGNLVVHEVVQAPDGTLRVKVPPEVDALFTDPVPIIFKDGLGEWSWEENALSGKVGDGFGACRLGPMPDQCRITATVTCTPGTRACGVLLRADEDLEGCYEVRWEPGRSRVVFDRWPRKAGPTVFPGLADAFVLECPLSMALGEPVELRIIVDGTIVVVYVNNEVALSTRAYNHGHGEWGLFVYEGEATFRECKLAQ